MFWRVAVVQVAAVAASSVVLALALPKSFFEDWGWLSGPSAWMACALVTARVVWLAPWRTLLGAALAGLPSVVFVVAGVHWLGALFAVALFAAWCASVGAAQEGAQRSGRARGPARVAGRLTLLASSASFGADGLALGAIRTDRPLRPNHPLLLPFDPLLAA